MNMISSICILVATIGVLFILLLFFQRRQLEQQNKKLRNFLKNLEEQQRICWEKFIAEQRTFEAEHIEKIKEWLLWRDNVDQG